MFPENPALAMERGFAEAERAFLDFAGNSAIKDYGQHEPSGSCAVCLLIVDDKCYLANVGDSRGIMSVDGGERMIVLSDDHKPEKPAETQRILDNGGKIYQDKYISLDETTKSTNL